MDNVIVLNADYQFINIIDWKKAMVLVIQNKVDVIKYSDRIIKTVNQAFKLPMVIKLVYLAQVIYKKRITFSKVNIFIRDDYVCAYCGKKMKTHKKDATIDHVLPRARGGKDTWENCVTACLDCNNAKGNKTPEEFGVQLRYKPYQPSLTQYIQFKMRFSGIDKILDSIF